MTTGTAGTLRYWRKAIVCGMGATLFLAASAAEAGWLDRIRGLSVGATGTAITAYVVHEASVVQSLNQNARELTDLFSDMLDAVKEGDTKTAEKIWSDVEKVPGDIVREAFPVFRVADAAAALAGRVRERLASVKRHIERFAREAGGIDPRSALEIPEDERQFYASTTGILGDEPLPRVQVRTAERALSEHSWAEFQEDRYRSDEWNDERQAPRISIDLREAHDSYDESLRSLDRLRTASRDVTKDHAELESGDYQEAVETLDRRRSEFEAERRRQLPEDHAGEQGRDFASEEDTAVAPMQSIKSSEEGKSTAQTSLDDTDTPPDDYKEEQTEGQLSLTCDTRKRAGLSLCVEYKYNDESEFRAALNQCSSSGNDARLDASCPKGQRAFVCQHNTDDSESLTYDYDPQRTENEFIAICERFEGRYLGRL